MVQLQQPIEEEQWRPIANEPGYEVSNLGRLRVIRKRSTPKYRGIPREQVLKPHYNKGYLRLYIGVGPGRRRYSVHQLVARAFLSNPHDRPQVNHKNMRRDDNRAENLEWCTQTENIRHRVRFPMREYHQHIEMLAD